MQINCNIFIFAKGADIFEHDCIYIYYYIYIIIYIYLLPLV